MLMFGKYITTWWKWKGAKQLCQYYFAYTLKKEILYFLTYHAFKGREGNVSRTNLAERFWVDKKYLDLLSLRKIFSWTIPYPAFEGLEIKKCECKVIFKGVSEIILV